MCYSRLHIFLLADLFILPLGSLSLPFFFLPFYFTPPLSTLDPNPHQQLHFPCRYSSFSCLPLVSSTQSCAFWLLSFCGFIFLNLCFVKQSLEWKGFIIVIIIPHLSTVNYLSHLLCFKWSKASYLLCSSSLPAVPGSSISYQHCLCSPSFILWAPYQCCSPWSRGSQWGATQMIF